MIKNDDDSDDESAAEDALAGLPVELDGGALADLMLTFDRARRQISSQFGGVAVSPEAPPELIAALEGQRSLLARIRADVRRQYVLLEPLSGKLGPSRLEELFSGFEAETDRARTAMARSGHKVHVLADAGVCWTGLAELDVTAMGEHIDDLYALLEPLTHVPMIATAVEDIARFHRTLYDAARLWNHWPAVRSGTEQEWEEALDDRDAVSDLLDIALESLSVLLSGQATADGPQWTIPHLVEWADRALDFLDQVDRWAEHFAELLWHDMEVLGEVLVGADVERSRLR